MNLHVQDSQVLRVATGLVLDGTVTLGTNASRVVFLSGADQHLDGTGTVAFASSGGGPPD